MLYKSEVAVVNQSGAMGAETISKNGRSLKSQMSRGNFLKYLVIAALAVAAVLVSSCGGGSGSSGSGNGKSSGKIKMTTEKGDDILFRLAGSGVATVDWGDGSEKVSLTLNEYSVEFKHTYPSATIRGITINGDNVTKLECWDITSLDVSRCTELTYLWCGGQFTSLDLSKNTELTYLWCGGQITSLDLSKNTALTNLNVLFTKLDAAALNAMFRTLHSNAGEKIIYERTMDCDRSIAENKGWRFY